MAKEYVLMVSGGPDSMYLLTKYHAQALAVVHVNYHQRPVSDQEAKLVQSACAKYSVPFYTLDVTPEAVTGNFQVWARKVRYDYAQQICQTVSCKFILTAHHRDDFIETGMMQMQTNRTPRQFGISQYSQYQGTNLYRPLLKISKQTIVNYLVKSQIAYATDLSNYEPIYERNRVRLELKQLSINEVKQRYQWLIMVNRILAKKYRRVDAKVSKWKALDYDLAFWNSIKRDRLEILFTTLHQLVPSLDLPSTKLASCEAFLNAAHSQKQFVLNDQYAISKANHQLTLVLL